MRRRRRRRRERDEEKQEVEEEGEEKEEEKNRRKYSSGPVVGIKLIRLVEVVPPAHGLSGFRVFIRKKLLRIL